MTIHNVGLVGLGKMGSLMAEPLSEKYSLWVKDQEQGVAQGLAARLNAVHVDVYEDFALCDAVILMLPNSAIVESVVLGSGGQSGLIAALKPGATIIDMGSSDPASTVKLEAIAKKEDITFLDAPVSGGRAGAAARKLSIMVGGDLEQFERIQEVVSVLGTKIQHVGPVGAGHALKAINNMIAATHILTLAEGVRLAREYGVTENTTLNVINASSGSSEVSQNLFPHIVLHENRAFGFSLGLMAKDCGIALNMQNALNLESIVFSESSQYWEDLVRIYGFDADMTDAARHILDAPHT